MHPKNLARILPFPYIVRQSIYNRYLRKQGIKTIGQFHDEVIALVEEGEEEVVKDKMEKAVSQLNKELSLNVPLGTDVQFGNTYAEIH